MAGNRRESRSSRRRLGVGALALWAVCLAAAAAASAASIDSLGVQGEAVEDAPWVLAASGHAEGELFYFATIKPVGGTPCGVNDGADDGTSIAFSEQASGAWSIATPTTSSHTLNPGAYLVCAWLQSGTGQPAAAATSAVVNVRQAHAVLTVTPRRRAVAPGSPITVRFQGSSELERQLFAKVKPASAGGCAAGYDADGGEDFLFAETTHGAFDFAKPHIAPSRSGRYRLCAWVGESSSDLQPEAAAQATFTVRTCASARAAYRRAKRRLRAARRAHALRRIRRAKRLVSRARGDARAICAT